jgi:hypothetical protein
MSSSKDCLEAALRHTDQSELVRAEPTVKSHNGSRAKVWIVRIDQTGAAREIVFDCDLPVPIGSQATADHEHRRRNDDDAGRAGGQLRPRH